jgi:hypothetical protein
MATKYTNIFNCKTLQNLHKLLFFWFENVCTICANFQSLSTICTYIHSVQAK